MSHLFFIFLLICFMAVRPILAIIIVVLRSFIPFFKLRLDFERKNLVEEASLRKMRADFCFEVSSEGELEQVRALLEEALKRKKKIEIIYSSASVESKCNSIYKDHPLQVRLLRLPILSGAPTSFLYFQSVWEWVSAPTIIFCRYDFFPELLLLKLFSKKFVLISGATKKPSWYKLESFKFFDVVVAATDIERDNFEAILGEKVKVYSCDFRVPRVTKRFAHADEILSQREELHSLLEKLKRTPASKKLILGSAWASDLKILNHPELIQKVKSGELFIVIAPHKLDELHVSELHKGLVDFIGSDQIEVVSSQTPYQKSPIVILQVGGILCEMYSQFSITYVGGGYERSIHSVLEPLFSDNVVITGPVIHRSTEFDLAQGLVPSEIHVLNNPESFYNIFSHIDVMNLDLKGRSSFQERTDQVMTSIFKDILG
ncbi:MAG: hypothetical protein K2Q18_13980 [Bdellovibrionales bacterium]|nr:hypothetical protein [Bdellovibrionales bacterium]